MNRKTAFAMISVALMICGAFLCCSFISDDSEAAFSYHESTRGTLTNSSTPNAVSGSTNVFGTILNPYTGMDVDLRNMSGTNIAYVQVGSQVRLTLGTTALNHTNAIAHGWSYSNGIYTCTVTSSMDHNYTPFLDNPVRSLAVHPVSNPGFLNSGEYWYGASSSTEPVLGINISDINDLMWKSVNETLYIAVGASVYIGPYQDEGEQYIGNNSIGLSQAGNGSISGTVSGVGTATIGLFTPYDGDSAITISAVSYSELVPITASDMVVIQNNTLTFTPVPAGNTVSISGAPWLSVNGNVVSGTPTVIGDYIVTITCGESTKTITIRVISELTVTNSPANGIIVMPS